MLFNIRRDLLEVLSLAEFHCLLRSHKTEHIDDLAVPVEVEVDNRHLVRELDENLRGLAHAEVLRGRVLGQLDLLRLGVGIRLGDLLRLDVGRARAGIPR